MSAPLRILLFGLGLLVISAIIEVSFIGVLAHTLNVWLAMSAFLMFFPLFDLLTSTLGITFGNKTASS